TGVQTCALPILLLRRPGTPMAERGCAIRRARARDGERPDSVAAMAATPPPGPPPVTGIDLTQFSEIVNNARTDDERSLTTPLVATAGDGTPDLAYRGSTMVLDRDNLAWWERTTGRETMANLGKNKRVAVWVR